MAGPGTRVVVGATPSWTSGGENGEYFTSDEETLASYRASTSGGETPLHTVWAGQAIDLIHDVPSAGDIVRVSVGKVEDVLING